METNNGIPAFYASTQKDWRNWLEKNSQHEKSVCLIIYHKKSATPSVYYSEAIEEALCFGWIDGKANKRDEQSSYLFFKQRNPKSNWSKINRDRVDILIQKGLMTESGQAFIDLAKSSGTWELLADVQNNIIPDDMQKLFDQNEIAYNNFRSFSPSSKRIILEWIVKAKKAETREKRMVQTVELAARNIKANH